MFKNIRIYAIASPLTQDLASAQEAMEPARFTECGASQEKSIGWVEPRGIAHGALIESINGQWLLKLQSEAKILPGSVVKSHVDKKCVDIEQSTGRKPGKREKREITEEARMELLSKAFTKQATHLIWIDKENNRIIINAGSQGAADMITTILVKTFEGLALRLIETKQTPSSSMAMWLNSQEMPSSFTADRDCVLKACDESKSSVRYAKHPLDIEEVQVHIQKGKIPTQLSMTWDSRVSFVLTDTGLIKKLEFLETCFESDRKESADAFDADAAIATGELSKLIPDLIDALGGEVEQQA
jgi:recombination associated protein RdgC